MNVTTLLPTAGSQRSIVRNIENCHGSSCICGVGTRYTVSHDVFAVSVFSNGYRVVREDVFAGVVCFQRVQLGDAFVICILLTRKRRVYYYANIFSVLILSSRRKLRRFYIVVCMKSHIV